MHLSCRRCWVHSLALRNKTKQATHPDKTQIDKLESKCTTEEMKCRKLTVNGCLGEQCTMADDHLIVIKDEEEASITARNKANVGTQNFKN